MKDFEIFLVGQCQSFTINRTDPSADQNFYQAQVLALGNQVSELCEFSTQRYLIDLMQRSIGSNPNHVFSTKFQNTVPWLPKVKHLFGDKCRSINR